MGDLGRGNHRRRGHKSCGRERKKKTREKDVWWGGGGGEREKSEKACVLEEREKISFFKKVKVRKYYFNDIRNG
jgi:hypothetical protein